MLLVVAPHAAEAKQLGKQYFDQKWQKQHTDRVLHVDDCIAIDCVHGRYVALVEAEFDANIWENTYLVLIKFGSFLIFKWCLQTKESRFSEQFDEKTN